MTSEYDFVCAFWIDFGATVEESTSRWYDPLIMKRLLLSIITLIVMLGLVPSAVHSAEQAGDYAQGKACYQRLLKSGKGSGEASWKRCISFFEDYYKADPSGSKALAALYSSARLKQERYAFRGSLDDAEGAVRNFNELVRQFPTSSLADDALYRIGCLREEAFGQPDRAAKAFRYILEHYPKGDMALQAGARLKKLGGQTPAPQVAAPIPAEEAVSPAQAQEESPSENDETHLGTVPATAARLPAESEKGASTPKPSIEEVDLPAKSAAASPPVWERKEGVADAFHPATLSGVSVRNSPEETTVYLRLDRDVEHSVEFTDRGVRTGSPPELDVFLLHTRSDKKIADERLVESNVLDGYEVKRLILSSGIKVSFTLKHSADYKVRKTDSGLAVIFGGNGVASSVASIPVSAETKKRMAAQLSNIRIVVDPGHGGDDEGAVGPDGTLEKNVTLALAKRLSAELREKLGARVYLTRTSDKALSLEERNAIAITKKADLFISIHANAARDAKASGVETYYLNNASDEAAERLAARENKSAMKKLSEVEHIISTMLQNYDAAESKILADAVQGRLSKKLNRSHGEMKNRGVRSALFYVLVGAKCPAILVETAFISNPREERLLTERGFQRDAAQAIADGVKQYFKVRDKALVSL